MKLTVERLGPIAAATLPILPLTVLIGKNQSGKTTLSYALYGAVNGPAILGQPVQTGPQTLGTLIETAMHLRFSLESPGEFFQDRSGAYSGGSASLTFDSEEIEAAVRSAVGLKSDTPRHKQIRSPSDRRRNYWAESDVVDLIRRVVQQLSLGAPMAIPAERNALVLTFKMLAVRRYRELRDRNRRMFAKSPDPDALHLVTSGLGEPLFAEPVERFLDFLTDAEYRSSTERRFQGNPRRTVTRVRRTKVSNSTRGSALAVIADQLEQSLLGTQRVTWQRHELFDGAELSLTVRDGVSIGLHLASGAAKQIAPLLLWLRSDPTEGMLIIDEPELGLHPTAQAKVLEVLALIAQVGVRVLVTTHSADIVAHLNNLMAGYRDNQDERAALAQRLFLHDPRAFLRPNQVGAFQVEDGAIEDLYDPDWGIRWRTLSLGSEEIQALYFDLATHPADSVGGHDDSPAR